MSKAAGEATTTSEKIGTDLISKLLQQRYGAQQNLSGSLPATDIIETLLAHRSVRFYLPQSVPVTALELAVSAAQSAPSSSNLQAWSVVAVGDKDRKARINAVAGNQKQIDQAPLFLVWLADLSRLRRVATNQGSTSDGLDYLESFLLAVIDAALAAQNAVIAFESLGLGTCYIGALRNNPIAVAKELALPKEVLPVFGLTVGYPDPAIRTDIKPRLPKTKVLHSEQYENDSKSADFSDYNEVLRAFQKIQLLPAIDWTEQISRRIETKDALKNRHELSAAIKTLGFKLK
ncbi:NADPH-dependent oxidoreductase [Phyllobacterium zundukense]|uniref:NADPH-dependent oxidoreductase n=1 Tax=Phyllobacterium zundukense TaxID=1867719 RepID=A0A2N9VPX3_9HYPH|nr:NADPH-dependent oxidoreductase [Phyllobacterium zundukense]ATU94948.1 NADPH-dependent oxidoreductase [Phyllobacterium zundukense]PIO41541.1 NADPH-dependent oxidoreductase [Phyllobacterium zundukense]